MAYSPGAALFDYGIKLSTNGFQIPGRLGDAIASNAGNLALDANAMATYFNADGSPQNGRHHDEPALCENAEGAGLAGRRRPTGDIAKDIVAKAAWGRRRQDAHHPQPDDFDRRRHRAKKRDPVCTTYRDAYHVCTMAPPLLRRHRDCAVAGHPWANSTWRPTRRRTPATKAACPA